ncbi:hypothetical protein DI43_14665 [Geobacillus sp. CAMR12739]|nr:hypothetical protein DI43_14665 [Geobacillus sp. CAMR12739]
MDVTDREQVKEVFARVKEEFGSIDILVNNAGTLDHVSQIEKQNDEFWERDLRVNLTGTYNCTKAVWPYMKEQGWGGSSTCRPSPGRLAALARRAIRPRKERC